MTIHHNHHHRNDWDGGLVTGPHPGISIRMWLYGQIVPALIIANPSCGPRTIAESASDYVEEVFCEYIAEKTALAPNPEDVGGRG